MSGDRGAISWQEFPWNSASAPVHEREETAQAA